MCIAILELVSQGNTYGRTDFADGMLLVVLGYLFLCIRIITLGAERIFLKFFSDFSSLNVASIFFMVAGISISPLFIFLPRHVFRLSAVQIAIILGVSVFYACGFYAYVHAISLADTSLIAPLYNASLLWLLLFGSIFLQERVGILRIVGGIIMFAGVFVLYPGGLVQKLSAIRQSPGSLYMIAGSVFLAMGRTIDGYIIVGLGTNVYLYAFLSNFLIGLYVFVIVVLTRQVNQIGAIIRSQPVLLVIGSSVTGWSYVSLLLAFQLIDVTVAEPLTLLSVFVTAVLAKFILDEEIRERLPGTVIMVIGAVLLVVS